MLLGLKDQFIPFVEDGSKRHSIRAGERWKVGMRADLYARPRQKDMRLIFRAPVMRVEAVDIEGGWETLTDDFFGDIKIAGSSLISNERDLFAWHDGLRPHSKKGSYTSNCRGSFAAMMEFWRGRLPFHGQIIHWDYDLRFTDRREECYNMTLASARIFQAAR